MSRLVRSLRLAAACAAAFNVASGTAWACPVCYGAADNAMIDGAKASVLFMGALVYALLGAAVVAVVVIRRHARKLADRHADPHGDLKLVQPTEGVAR